MKMTVKVFSVCPTFQHQPVRDTFIRNRLFEVFQKNDWQLIEGSTDVNTHFVFEGPGVVSEISEMIEALQRLETTRIECRVS